MRLRRVARNAGQAFATTRQCGVFAGVVGGGVLALSRADLLHMPFYRGTPGVSKQRPVCIITGASSGIGAATARLAGRRDFAVVVDYLRNEAGARAVVSDVVRAGGEAVAIKADVSRAEDVAALFEQAAALGRPAALVNNAAEFGARVSVGDLDPAQLDRILAVNLGGPMLCTAEAVRRMSTRRGGNGGSDRQRLLACRADGRTSADPLCGHQGGPGSDHGRAGPRAWPRGHSRECGPPRRHRDGAAAPGRRRVGGKQNWNDPARPCSAPSRRWQRRSFGCFRRPPAMFPAPSLRSRVADSTK